MALHSWSYGEHPCLENIPGFKWPITFIYIRFMRLIPTESIMFYWLDHCAVAVLPIITLCFGSPAGNGTGSRTCGWGLSVYMDIWDRTESLLSNWAGLPWFLSFCKDFIYLFIFREKGRDEERGINIYVTCDIPAPKGEQTWNPEMALTRNGTGDPLLCGMTPNQLSHTSHNFCILRCLLTKRRLLKIFL